MKVAIIGGGISGLTAAFHLCSQHDITLIEANDYVGGHTNTVAVEIEGEQHAIDTGFIVFNDRTYPNFCRLMDQLGVPSQPTSMTFSIRCDRTGLEYRGADLGGLFAQRRNLFRPRFYRFLRDFLRFNQQASEASEAIDETLTVGEFFRRENYSREFIEQYFLPMGSAIWSCPRGAFEEFPIRFIIKFYRHHGLLSITDRPQWRVIQGGSKNYVTAMTRRFTDSIHVNCPVVSVRRDATGVEIRTNRWTRRYDHVVFACHSDQALRILGDDASAAEREVLGAFPYERNVALLHSDPALLPKTRRAWACWNYHLTRETSHQATVTYNMNLLQGIRSRHVFCVTLNGEQLIDPHKVLGRFVYHHPVFTIQRSAAQRRHQELIGVHRSSFCGAYWGNGFHEDGVNSALAVCRVLNQPESTVSQPLEQGVDLNQPCSQSP